MDGGEPDLTFTLIQLLSNLCSFLGYLQYIWCKHAELKALGKALGVCIVNRCPR